MLNKIKTQLRRNVVPQILILSVAIFFISLLTSTKEYFNVFELLFRYSMSCIFALIIEVIMLTATGAFQFLEEKIDG